MTDNPLELPTTTQEEFSAFFEAIELAACEELKSAKHHKHIAILIGPGGQKAVVDFDEQVGDYMRTFGSSFDQAKSNAFLTIANVAYLARARGIIEICEGWMAASATDECRTPEDAAAFRQKIIETYGSIEKMPGRGEALLVNGCWGSGPGKRIVWIIKRMGDEILLIDRACRDSPGDVDRLSWLEQAVEKVHAEEAAK
jgi:hypothetical protein